MYIVAELEHDAYGRLGGGQKGIADDVHGDRGVEMRRVRSILNSDAEEDLRSCRTI